MLENSNRGDRIEATGISNAKRWIQEVAAEEVYPLCLGDFAHHLAGLYPENLVTCPKFFK